MSRGSWRVDPDLRGKFHPDHPDDLQVLVHDGEPRRTKKPPEACWVQVIGEAGTLRAPNSDPGSNAPLGKQPVVWSTRTVYAGKLLNQPVNLSSVRQGSTVTFVHAPGMPHPLLVTDAYRKERERWSFTPCSKCGADQSLDPPTVMAQTRFPGTPPDHVPVGFTAFCPCGGTMVLALLNEATAPPEPPPQAATGAKPWWKVW